MSQDEVAKYEHFLISANKLFLTSAQRADRARIIKARKKEQKRVEELAKKREEAEKKVAEHRETSKAKMKLDKNAKGTKDKPRVQGKRKAARRVRCQLLAPKEAG